MHGLCSQYVSKDAQSPTDFIPQLCPDPALTAFAQLGSLKLNTQRTLISLFSRHNQHVIAEATRTLSLQNDGGDEEEEEAEDGLWLGCCHLAYERSFCKYVLNHSETGEVIMVPDMQQDDRFSKCRDVFEFPHARFIASAPILSPRNHVIGAYTVIDDKPHPALDPKHSKFLKDMARTVMGYLGATRAKGQQLRAERMLVGIGSFLEGKGSLRHAWLKASEPAQSPLEDEDEGVEGKINKSQQVKQVVDDTAQDLKEKATSKSVLPDQSENTKIPQNSRPSYKRQDPESRLNKDRGTLSSQVSDAFSRAANIARESLEVEGIVYFDANFASHGSLVGSFKSDSEFSATETSDLSDDGKRVTSKDIPMRMYDAEKWSGSCRMLSYSTTDSSSINQELIRDKSIAMSEVMVRGLLRRYPRGKIFNFSEEGSISSDDSTDGTFKDFFRRGNTPSKTGGETPRPARKYKKTRRAMLLQDARALLQLAPGARSIIFMPLWDSHKNRWYSGCIAWTRTPDRIFTTDDELTFLFALGNSVMAEAHRIGAECAEQAKTDLLSSLSHELRSPLHGVFGIAELLDDSLLSSSQHNMVQMIESCAKTLLDTINHLLQYARINHLQQSTPNRSSEWDNPDPTKSAASNSSDVSLRGTTGAPKHLIMTQLDTVLEEVVESVFAGYAFLQGPASPQIPGAQGGVKQIDYSKGEIKIILDMDCAKDWRFLFHPGRWRLILMDVFGNALKFTKRGYIHISLNATAITTGVDDNPIESQITLTVSDTGIGIGETYLNNDLFEAFSQENVLSHGTGLGLHVAHHTISSLGGDIRIQSRKGFGTEVITKVKLDHPPESDSSANSVTVATRQLVQGRSIGILGLGDSEADKVLGPSLKKLCQDWFSMEVFCVTDASQPPPQPCDYYLVTQEDMDLSSIPRRPGERFAAPVIVVCSTPANASAMYSSMQIKGGDDVSVVEYISQPCGPRKIAKALKSCCSKQRDRHDLVDKKSKIIGPSPTVTELPVRPDTSEEEKGAINGEDAKSGLPEVNVVEAPLPPFSSPDRDHEAGRDSKEESETGQSELRVADSVLIVDDNEINVRILEAYMKKLGYDYAVAQNGLEALNAFKTEPGRFKIILMGKYPVSPDIFTR